MRQALTEIWVENSIFTIKHIGYRNSFTEVPPQFYQTNPFAYCCSFTFQRHEWSRGERCKNAEKQLT